MKEVVVNYFVNIGEVMLVVLMLCGLILAVFLLVAVMANKKDITQKQAKQQECETLAGRLQKMSDLELKLWYSGYRKMMYPPRYNDQDMLRVILTELKKRGIPR